MKRNHQVDLLRGIGIVLVVLGHSYWVLPEDIWRWVYGFHMPLFFFLSGYMQSDPPKKGFGVFAWRRVRSVLLPYLGFYLVSFLLTVLFAHQTMDGVFLLASVKGLLLGNRYILIANFALWFLPLFFLANLAFYGVRKLPRWLMAAVILCVGLLSPIYAWLESLGMETKLIPWNLYVIFPALFFMGLGLYARRGNYFALLEKKKLLQAPLHLLLGLLGLWLHFRHPQEIILISGYDYLLTAVCLLDCLFFLAAGGRSAALEFLGRSSLWILGLHRILLALAQQCGLEKLFSFLPEGKGLLKALCVDGAVILLCLLTMLLWQGMASRIKKQRTTS